MARIWMTELEQRSLAERMITNFYCTGLHLTFVQGPATDLYADVPCEALIKQPIGSCESHGMKG